MRTNAPLTFLCATVTAAFLFAATSASAAVLIDIKSDDSAAQVLVKQTICEGAVALIVGIRAADQLDSVLARLPDKVAKSATKLAHTRLMIVHADTKSFKLLMKDQDVLTVHQNTDPKRAKEQVAKAKRMNALKVAAEFTPVSVIVALALSEDASPADIAKTGKALLESLSGLGIKHVKTFKYIPHVAMAVSKAALQALTASPLVCGVNSDQQARPL